MRVVCIDSHYVQLISGFVQQVHGFVKLLGGSSCTGYNERVELLNRMKKQLCSFRLEPEAVELLERLAETRNVSKTDIVSDALRLLAEVEQLDLNHQVPQHWLVTEQYVLEYFVRNKTDKRKFYVFPNRRVVAKCLPGGKLVVAARYPDELWCAVLKGSSVNGLLNSLESALYQWLIKTDDKGDWGVMKQRKFF